MNVIFTQHSIEAVNCLHTHTHVHTLSNCLNTVTLEQPYHFLNTVYPVVSLIPKPVPSHKPFTPGLSFFSY